MKKVLSPFIYSDDNKRYHTYNYYLRHRFNSKTYKVPLDAGFTCPNRDGKCGIGGCIFCSSQGSGEFTQPTIKDLMEQYSSTRTMMENKWPNALGIPYFQSYTNTYGSLDRIKECIELFYQTDSPAIAIATRADCLEKEKIDYLVSLCDKKEIWVELGLQSAKDSTAEFINRGHNFETFKNKVLELANTPIKICVHIINGLPYETEEDMLNTARELAKLPIHGIKIHMLHISKNTKIANMHECNPFKMLTLEEYVDIVIKQLEILPPEVVIQRLTGDPVKSELITPEWTLNKTNVLNTIDKEMKKRDTWQGKTC